MNIINTTEQLQNFCSILQRQEFITVDSEFIREHTYYPKLCLVQVACPDASAIIDPLASIDLSDFFAVLQNPRITKVFHAGRQDIEIFYHLTGKIPQNVFDTQIAAMVCGYPENIGYGNLVHEILGIELDKSCRLTDWSIRPLDDQQLSYALGDVTHLMDCYRYLQNYLHEHHRTDWIKEEIDELCNEASYKTDPQEAWHKIRHNVYSVKFLSALKYLACWREERAKRHNTPKSSICRDDVLLNIASVAPKSIEELHAVRNLKADVIRGKLGAEIIEALDQSRRNPLSVAECRADRKNHCILPNTEQSLLEILKLLLRIQSQEAGVVSKIIATEEDLRYIIADNQEKTHTLNGWRYEIFGRYARQLCNGELSITYNPKKKRIEIK